MIKKVDSSNVEEGLELLASGVSTVRLIRDCNYLTFYTLYTGIMPNSAVFIIPFLLCFNLKQ